MMRLKKNKFVGLTISFSFALVILLLSFVPTVTAQEFDETPPPIPCGGNKPIARRNLDEILCLENDQRKNIRLINAEMKPQLDVARRRMQFAQRVLDETIYGKDVADEAVVEQRARELATAQADFARTRALTDLKIRRVLTQEQVVRFLYWRRWMMWQNNQRMKRDVQNQTQVNRPRQNINNSQPQRNNKQPNEQQKRPQGNKRP